MMLQKRREIFSARRVAMVFGDLTEDQDQYRQDSGGNSGTGAAKNMNGKGGSQRRSGQVDHVIADQDRTKHLCGVIRDFQYPGGTLVSFLCQ